MSISAHRAMRFGMVISLLAVISVLYCGGSADAGFLTFTDKSSFLASVGPTTLESFENTPLRAASPDPLVLNGMTVTSNTPFGVVNQVAGGGQPTDGTQYLEPSGGGAYTVTFTFNTPIDSFGIHIIDFGDAGSGSLFLHTNTGDSFTIATVPPLLSDGNVLFFGIQGTSTTFTEVTIEKTTTGEGILLDELYFQTIDHFLCYKAKLTGGNICSSDAPSNAGGSCETEEECGGTTDDSSFCVPNKFPKGVQVSLSDQFEDKAFDVKKPVNLCAPADKNEEGIKNPDTHLKGYQIKEVKGEPKHVPQTNIKVRNQFHEEGSELVVDTIKPDRLLVPTAKDLNNPVDPPDNDAHSVDHYKCYKVKVTPGTPKFEPILGVKVEDQFIEAQSGQPKLFDLKKPTTLCTPVRKEVDGEITEIKNPDIHLMCYQANPAKGQPKHVKVLGIHVNNQFGPEQLDTVKEEELCVPSEKIIE